ncbi:hypothetical protein C0J52_22862 [Blattella germanica]|nr:hypothetical protein C0J52_22862 [Blattella germanica]
MFLVCDDVKEALNILLNPRPEAFSKWLSKQMNCTGEQKLIEALCMIQNFQMLENLVDDGVFRKMKTKRQSPEFSMNISRVRKNLYEMCEKMSGEELEKVVEGMSAQCGGLRRRFNGDIMELNLLHWDLEGYISMGDSNGHGVNLDMLKLVLEKIGMRDVFDSFDSGLLHVDGPSPPVILPPNNIKRLLSNGCANLEEAISKRKRKKSNCDYNIDSENVGICLIINQKNFYRERNPRYNALLVPGILETRYGTDIDRDRLKEMFDSMGFITIVEENLSHVEMLNKLRDCVRTQFTNKHSCFVLCILSHGVQGMVCGVNSVALYEEELENVFKDEPALINIPKVMILQACQGEKLQRGTWFVESLWQHFLEDRNTGDICTLFTKVTSDLSSRWENIDGRCRTMVPRYSTTLTRQLVLPLHPAAKYKVALLMFQRFFFQELLKEYINRLYEMQRRFIMPDSP